MRREREGNRSHRQIMTLLSWGNSTKNTRGHKIWKCQKLITPTSVPDSLCRFPVSTIRGSHRTSTIFNSANIQYFFILIFDAPPLFKGGGASIFRKLIWWILPKNTRGHLPQFFNNKTWKCQKITLKKYIIKLITPTSVPDSLCHFLVSTIRGSRRTSTFNSANIQYFFILIFWCPSSL
jgi:hypothetical protein